MAPRSLLPPIPCPSHLPLQRHDGQAVTCDDFYQAMADANADHAAHGDLPALRRWYGQSGTPRLAVRTTYDAAAQTFTIHAKQVTPATAGQPAETKVRARCNLGYRGSERAAPDLSSSPGPRSHPHRRRPPGPGWRGPAPDARPGNQRRSRGPGSQHWQQRAHGRAAPDGGGGGLRVCRRPRGTRAVRPAQLLRVSAGAAGALRRQP